MTAITETLILSMTFRPLFLFYILVAPVQLSVFPFLYQQERIRLIRSNGKALNSNLKSMKTMGETELSCFEYFINNIYPNIAVDTTNIASGVFVNNQYVAYIGSKPDANFASFLFVGYGIRVMHVTNAGGNWQSSILNNL